MWERILEGVVRDPATTAVALREQEFDSLEDILEVPPRDWRQLKAKTVQDLLAFLENKQRESVATMQTTRVLCRFFNSAPGCMRGASCSFAHVLTVARQQGIDQAATSSAHAHC